MFTADIGSCENCGHYTPSGGHSLCEKCAVKLDQCASCRQSIQNEPADDPHEKRMHIVTFDRNERPGKKGSRKETIDSAKEFTSAASAALRAWMDQNDLKDVEVVNELSSICTVFINCSIEQAQKIKSGPLVDSVSRGD